MKTETTHTPGLWYCNGYAAKAGGEPWNDNYGIFVDLGKIGQRQIAALKRPSFQEPSWADDIEANAALIARAPDMAARIAELEALNGEILAALRGCVMFFESDPNRANDGWMSDAYRIARAAIGKAEGDGNA